MRVGYVCLFMFQHSGQTSMIMENQGTQGGQINGPR